MGLSNDPHLLNLRLVAGRISVLRTIVGIGCLGIGSRGCCQWTTVLGRFCGTGAWFPIGFRKHEKRSATRAAHFAPIAQSAEHLTLNQRVLGSSPSGGIFSSSPQTCKNTPKVLSHAGVWQTSKLADIGILGVRICQKTTQPGPPTLPICWQLPKPWMPALSLGSRYPARNPCGLPEYRKYRHRSCC